MSDLCESVGPKWTVSRHATHPNQNGLDYPPPSTAHNVGPHEEEGGGYSTTLGASGVQKHFHISTKINCPWVTIAWGIAMPRAMVREHSLGNRSPGVAGTAVRWGWGGGLDKGGQGYRFQGLGPLTRTSESRRRLGLGVWGAWHFIGCCSPPLQSPALGGTVTWPRKHWKYLARKASKKLFTRH